MKKKKKYAMGTSVKNYLETPSNEAQKAQLMADKAIYEAKSSPFLNAMDMAGTAAMQIGLSAAAPKMGLNPQATNLLQSGALGLDQILSFAMGGQIPKNIPVEIEGKERVQMPGQKTSLEAVGPSHEKGGIDINLPEGTEIFSDRIKIDGVSMANRKKKRDKKSLKLEDLIENYKTDVLLKNTKELTDQNNEIEGSKDQQIQQFITNLLPQQEGERKKHFTDPIIGDDITYSQWENVWNSSDAGQVQKATPEMFEQMFPKNNQILDVPENKDMYTDTPSLFEETPVAPTTPTTEEATDKTNPFLDFLNKNSKYAPTLGDSVSLGGAAFSAFAPYFNTLKNRAEDTPNQNFFRDYGDEGLQKIEESKQYIDQNKEKSLSDAQLQSRSTQNSLRNSARGVNQLRTLDIANQQLTNRANNDIYSGFANQMMQVLQQQAMMENNQDQVFMGAEQARDLANRKDNDNFYTQLGRDKSNIGFGLQNIGRDINKIKQRGDNLTSVENLEEQALTNQNIAQFLQKALENYTKTTGK